MPISAHRSDPDFLVAFVNSGPGGDILRAGASGSSLPRIPKEAVEGLAIPPLPLEAQKRIGALEAARSRYASLLEKKINAERRLIEAIIRISTTTRE
jgi:restriction endonuclease S subunit